MKAIVKAEACIGCGACVAIEPDAFELNDEGIAVAKENIADDKLDSTKEAADSCPTGAIEVEE